MKQGGCLWKIMMIILKKLRLLLEYMLLRIKKEQGGGWKKLKKKRAVGELERGVAIIVKGRLGVGSLVGVSLPETFPNFRVGSGLGGFNSER